MKTDGEKEMKKNVYSAEFKREAIKLVLGEGVPVSKASTELGVSVSALGKWVREYRSKCAAFFPGSGNLSVEERQVRELEKKVRRLEVERDILKKATAFFAKEVL